MFDVIFGSRVVFNIYLKQVDHRCIQKISSLEDSSIIFNASYLTNNDDNNSSSGASNSNLLLGVRVIWVHKQHRGQKVATQLLDIARRHFSFGMVFDKINVAFSQPTEAGLSFAQRYMDSTEIRAYSST